MKYKPGQHVAFYDLRGETHRAKVIDASRDHVTIRLWSGREIRLDDDGGISRLARLSGPPPRRR